MNLQVSEIGESSERSNAATVETSIGALDLTPSLVLATALLYMIVCNGEVEQSEIDQWKSAIGANADLARCAVDCVQTVPLDQFLGSAAAALSNADKLCILTNVCDAMLSDGESDAAEFDLLVHCTEGFGISDDQFHPFYEAMVIKNDKSVLGAFDSEALHDLKLTPHLAWAAAMIYLLASDGVLSPDELARLQAMMGAFEGLPKAGVKYALKFKSDVFFTVASEFLNLEQKTFILTNAYDLLLCDGVAEAAEQSVFTRMFSAFGFTSAQFAAFEAAITAKNVRTFDTNRFTDTRTNSDVYFTAPTQDLTASASHQDVFQVLAKRISGERGIRRSEIVKIPANFISAKKLYRIAVNAAPLNTQGTAVIEADPRKHQAEQTLSHTTEVLPTAVLEVPALVDLPTPTDTPQQDGGNKPRPRTVAVDHAHHAQAKEKMKALREAMRHASAPVERSGQQALASLPHLTQLPEWTVALLTFLATCLAGASLLYVLLSSI